MHHIDKKRRANKVLLIREMIIVGIHKLLLLYTQIIIFLYLKQRNNGALRLCFHLRC